MLQQMRRDYQDEKISPHIPLTLDTIGNLKQAVVRPIVGALAKYKNSGKLNQILKRIDEFTLGLMQQYLNAHKNSFFRFRRYRKQYEVYIMFEDLLILGVFKVNEGHLGVNNKNLIYQKLSELLRRQIRGLKNRTILYEKVNSETILNAIIQNTKYLIKITRPRMKNQVENIKKQKQSSPEFLEDTISLQNYNQEDYKKTEKKPISRRIVQSSLLQTKLETKFFQSDDQTISLYQKDYLDDDLSFVQFKQEGQMYEQQRTYLQKVAKNLLIMHTEELEQTPDRDAVFSIKYLIVGQKNGSKQSQVITIGIILEQVNSILVGELKKQYMYWSKIIDTIIAIKSNYKINEKSIQEKRLEIKLQKLNKSSGQKYHNNSLDSIQEVSQEDKKYRKQGIYISPHLAEHINQIRGIKKLSLEQLRAKYGVFKNYEIIRKKKKLT